mmetsp:Transcript_2562/g.6970  ORF Transcript_2562/g.6970 Transcript_2562/m.6970 type:complete len:89 (-) Transcript_2562:1227-1493(-)
MHTTFNRGLVYVPLNKSEGRGRLEHMCGVYRANCVASVKAVEKLAEHGASSTKCARRADKDKLRLCASERDVEAARVAQEHSDALLCV